MSSFIRQLSVANQQRDGLPGEGRSPRNSTDPQNGCFIQRYLSGLVIFYLSFLFHCESKVPVSEVKELHKCLIALLVLQFHIHS